jgi:hypothetical protein
MPTFDLPIVTDAQRFATTIHEALKSAGQRIADAVLDGSGAFGSVIKAVLQGLADGGPIGAVVAGLTDLLMQSRQFRDVVTMLGGLVQSLADAVGALLEPLEPLIGAVSIVVDAIASALTPVFQALTSIVEPLIPPLVMLGEVLQVLAPVIGIVGKAFAIIMDPLMLLAGPVMRALFEVLKFVGTVILRIVQAIAPLWNGILGAISDVFRTISNLKIFGARPFAFLGDWADGLDAAKIDTDALAASLVALQGMTWESAKATANETAERMKGTKAIQNATEALTNVPEGYKVALARFHATDPISAPSSFSGSSSQTSAPSAPATGSTVINLTFNGITDTDEIVGKIGQLQRQREVARTGRPLIAMPRYTY